MSKIHFLQVKHGDALFIECDRGKEHGIILVDGGPTGFGEIIADKVKEIGLPDLMVLTHYDDDHIGGLTQYVKSCQDADCAPAGETWANCTGWERKQQLVSTRSARQGMTLSTRLNVLSREHGMVWNHAVCEGFKKEFPFASIEVVSPTEEVMGLALNEQEKVAIPLAKRAMKVERNELLIPLEELALEVPKEANLKVDSDLANAASIAFILRCDDLAILMLGDCYPHNVERYLRSQGYSEENPLVVDYVKVAHHGSRNNTSNSLLDIIQCDKFLISTDGDKFNHPDRATIAHILCHPKRNQNGPVHLYFNYNYDLLVQNRGAFLNDGELEKWNAVVHDETTEIEITAKKVEMATDAVETKQPAVTILELRSLKAAQVADLQGLMRELNPDITVTDKYLRRMAQLSATHLFAAVDDSGRIVGCATLCPYESPTGRKASVEDVVVASDFRGRGIGRALMEHLVAYAREELAPVHLNLTSSPWRTEANELYASLGFVKRDTNVYRLTIEVD